MVHTLFLFLHKRSCCCHVVVRSGSLGAYSLCCVLNHANMFEVKLSTTCYRFEVAADLWVRVISHQAFRKSKGQKEMAEEELLGKGPGSFPLERLLAIFQCITSVADGLSDDDMQANGNSKMQVGTNILMSDVLLQLSSLCMLISLLEEVAVLLRVLQDTDLCCPRI